MSLPRKFTTIYSNLLLLLFIGMMNLNAEEITFPYHISDNLNLLQQEFKSFQYKDSYLYEVKLTFDRNLKKQKKHGEPGYKVSLYNRTTNYHRVKLISSTLKKNTFRKIWISKDQHKESNPSITIRYQGKEPKARWTKNIKTKLQDPTGPFLKVDQPVLDLAKFMIDFPEHQNALYHVLIKHRYEKAGLERVNPQPNLGPSRRRNNIDLMNIFSGALAVQESLQLELLENPSPDEPQTIPNSLLKGPEIKSHPWDQLNSESHKAFTPGQFADYAPQDYFYASSKSLEELIQLEETLNGWISSLINSSKNVIQEINLRKKYLNLLGLGDNQLVKQLAGHVIGEVAIIAPDFFFIEGTSIAAVLELKQPLAFESYMNLKFSFDHQVTLLNKEVYELNNRGKKLYYLKQQDHVIIASTKSLMTNLISSKSSNQSLKQEGDFEYMRRLLPQTQDELLFIYFSDAAIRKWLSPKYKILGARRIRAQTQFINDQLENLVHKRQQSTNTESAYGKPWELTSIEELTFDKVTKSESESYKRFVESYSRYWSTYFDPIGIQINKTNTGTSLKTIVLPLIENSIYNTLTSMIGKTKPNNQIELIEGEVFQMSMNANLVKALPFLKLTNTNNQEKFNGLIKKSKLRIFDGEPIIYADLLKLQNGLAQLGGSNMYSYIGFISFLTMPSCLELEHTSKSNINTIIEDIKKRFSNNKWSQFEFIKIQEDYGTIDALTLSFFGISLRFYIQCDESIFRISNNLNVLRNLNSSNPIRQNNITSHAALTWKTTQMRDLLNLSQLNNLSTQQSQCKSARDTIRLTNHLGISKEQFKDLLGYTPMCPLNGHLDGSTCSKHGSIENPQIFSLNDIHELSDIEVYLTLNHEGLWSELLLYDRKF